MNETIPTTHIKLQPSAVRQHQKNDLMYELQLIHKVIGVMIILYHLRVSNDTHCSIRHISNLCYLRIIPIEKVK